MAKKEYQPNPESNYVKFDKDTRKKWGEEHYTEGEKKAFKAGINAGKRDVRRSLFPIKKKD